MRRSLVAVVPALLIALLTATPAQAIVFGQPDGNRHPHVGALVAEIDPASPGPEQICSGTLIAPDVFLTASHCTVFLPPDQFGVSFASRYDEDGTAAANGVIWGTAHTHPLFGTGGASDPHDIAVVVLDSAASGIAPAQLPTRGLLDRLQAGHQLRPATFTAVGYGAIRETGTGGPHGLLPSTGERMFALQSALSLQKSWLTLSMNPSTGNGGTCYGDSGGPHFLGGETSTLLASITVTGDAMCRATDKTYRVDTDSARAFLDDFVALP